MTALTLKLNADELSTPVQAAAPSAVWGVRRLRRTLAHCWDLVGVLALMGSSAAYVVYALGHLAS